MKIILVGCGKIGVALISTLVAEAMTWSSWTAGRMCWPS